MTHNRLTLTRLIVIHLLLMALAIAIVFIWRPGHAKPANFANVPHTGIIGEPLPPHCIYWDGSIAYDAPCQDYAIYAPLALYNPAWVYGPPPTPAPYAPIEAYPTPDLCWPPGANPCEG